MQPMLIIVALTATFFGIVADYGRCRPGERELDRLPVNHITGRAMLDRQTIHIHDLATEPEEKYLKRTAREVSAFGPCSLAPLLREGVRSARFRSADTKSAHSPRNRSHFLRLSRTKP